MMRLFLSALVGIIVLTTSAQKVDLHKVFIQFHNENGEKISKVKVINAYLTDTPQSNAEGIVTFELAEGVYTLLFSHESYNDATKTINVPLGEETMLNFVLKTGAITVKGRQNKPTNTIASVAQAKKDITQTVEVITAEEMARQNIRNTAQALAKTPGATIQDGKFANIRGMYDRYNAGYLNGAPLPGTESDRKAFSFDVVPANLVDNITIIKSASPNLIADFGGGIIQINTKQTGVKLVQNIQLGFQLHSLTSFANREVFATDAQNALGFADNTWNKLNTKNFNSISVADQKNQIGSFDNNWQTKTKNFGLAPRLNYTLNYPFKIGKKPAGLTLSYTYSFTPKFTPSTNQSRDYSDNRPRNFYNDAQTNMQVQNGIIANTQLQLTKMHSIEFKNLYVANFEQNTLRRIGTLDFDNAITTDGLVNYQNAQKMLSSQLLGIQYFNSKKTKLSYNLNYGFINKTIPDYRIAQYSTAENDRYFAMNDFFNAGSGRFFSKLNENLGSAAIDLSHKIVLDNSTHIISVGGFVQSRNRDFSSREFVYGPLTSSFISKENQGQDLSADGLKKHNIYLIEKTNLDLGLYYAKSALYSMYVSKESQMKLKNKELLKIVYGVRGEHFNQSLSNERFDSRGTKIAKIVGKLQLLPSVNFVLPLHKKVHIKTSYYRTLNRPEFRELASFAFYQFNINSEVKGNPDLKTAVLNNYDLRLEIFNQPGQLISLGGFYKKIINPIELSLDPSQPLIRTFNYQNAESADVNGVEFEVRQNLGNLFIHGPKWLSKFALFGNVALIKSKIKFNNTNSTQNRPLQGQSPIVFNSSLFYDNPKTGLNVSISVNRVGTRIAYIGLPKNAGAYAMDIYEKGRTILDLQVGRNFKNNSSIKVTFGDLLAQDLIFYQDVDGNKKYVKNSTDNALLVFKNGFTTNISYGLRF